MSVTRTGQNKPLILFVKDSIGPQNSSQVYQFTEAEVEIVGGPGFSLQTLLSDHRKHLGQTGRFDTVVLQAGTNDFSTKFDKKVTIETVFTRYADFIRLFKHIPKEHFFIIEPLPKFNEDEAFIYAAKDQFNQRFSSSATVLTPNADLFTRERFIVHPEDNQENKVVVS